MNLEEDFPIYEFHGLTRLADPTSDLDSRCEAVFEEA